MSDYGDQRACIRKRQYMTRARAKIAASIVRKRFGSTVKPYRCRICRHYHLATKKEEAVDQ